MSPTPLPLTVTEESSDRHLSPITTQHTDDLRDLSSNNKTKVIFEVAIVMSSIGGLVSVVTIIAIVVVGATVIYVRKSRQPNTGYWTKGTGNGNGHCYQSGHTNAINSCDKEANFDIRLNTAYEAFKFPSYSAHLLERESNEPHVYEAISPNIYD